MTETERIRRVREMERRMHELSAAAEGLQTALAAYEAALPARRALEDYYESPLWQEDFAADEAGLLPADLCRGVLTEDALFDLLGDTDLLHGELTRVAREACARTKFIVRPVMTTKHARRAGGAVRARTPSPRRCPRTRSPTRTSFSPTNTARRAFSKRSSPPRTSPWVTNTPVRHLPRSEVPAFYRRGGMEGRLPTRDPL